MERKKYIQLRMMTCGKKREEKKAKRKTRRKQRVKDSATLQK